MGKVLILSGLLTALLFIYPNFENYFLNNICGFFS